MLRYLFVCVVLALSLSINTSIMANTSYSTEDIEMIIHNAERGDVDAQYRLGVMYDFGEGVNQDSEQARHWFEKAAEQGDANAQYFLGVKYDFGEGVNQDSEQARYWFEKAAEQGNTDAQIGLGLIYQNGHGVRQNKRKAKEFFGQACDKGEQAGCDAYRSLNEQGY